MNNLRIDFGFGVQIKGDGSLLTHEERAVGLARIREAAVDYFGGCTLYRTDGDWKDAEARMVYSEQGATLSVLTADVQHGLDQRIKNLAEFVKRQLSQKAVYVTRCPVQSELY